MKKILFAIALVAVFSVAANAQKGSLQVSPGIESGIPTGQFADGVRAGFGINGKVLYGLTDAGYLTGTTGYMSFKNKGSGDGYKAKLSIIPVLAGYRQNFNGFYAEPQLGIGFYGSKEKYDNEKSTDSQAYFTWAIGGGYVYNSLDFGLRYQRAEGSGGGIGFFGLKVAYNLPVGGK